MSEPQQRTEEEEAQLKANFDKKLGIFAAIALVMSIVSTELGLSPFLVTLPGNAFKIVMDHLIAIMGNFLLLYGICEFGYIFYCYCRGILPRNYKRRDFCPHAHSSTDHHHPDIPSVNPATGKPLTHGGSGLDTGGNTYGSGS